MAVKRTRKPATLAHEARLGKLGIEALCDMMREGLSYARIGQKLKMPGTRVWKWIQADEERQMLARDALQQSADAADAMAEQVLLAIKKGASGAEISRARELAQHYRWRASKRNPRVYGERVEVDGAIGVAALTEQQVDERLLKLLGAAGKATG